MTTDVASLVLEVDSRQARTATRDLQNLAKGGGIAQTAMGGLTGFVGGLAGSLLSAAAAGAALSKAISVQRQFDVINAGLMTATGSADGAAVAFDALSDFAATTPYDLAQVSDSFIKLVNLGLDPSERALRSYGNTASAMGKDLNMMIEAVADAATGEFERLKEFGIKAKSEGDKVKLTFQGVTTTIGKNAAEIEQYMIAIGEDKFGDAMANRMDSLDGKLSNLGDSWDAMFRNIMGSDVGAGIEGMVDLALDALEAVNDYLASGEFEGHIDQMGAAFGPFVDDAKEALGIIWGLIQEQNSNIEKNNPELLKFLTSAWQDFPENVRAFVQLATVEFAASLEYWKNEAILWRDTVKAIFTDDTIEAAMKRNVEAQRLNAQVRLDSIDYILQERDAIQAAQKAAEEKAAADKAEYERKKAEKPTGDRLAGFRIGGDKPAGASDGAKKAADAAAKKAQRELDQLRGQLATEEEEIAASYAERERIITSSLGKGTEEYERLMGRSRAQRDRELQELAESRSRDLDNLARSLMTEEEAIQDSYNRRIEIINENSTATEAVKQTLRDKVEADRQQELADFAASQQAQRDQLWQGLLTEQEMMVQYHEQRKQEILTSTLATEKERQELLRREEERFMRESADRERNRLNLMVSTAGDLFGSLSQLMGQLSQAQGKEGKKAFEMSKKLAIAQTVMKTYESATNAYASLSSIPYVGPALGAAAAAAAIAAGMANIANIRSQQYSGSYDQGGYIPAGKWGWVGEAGPEKVRGPAAITGRKVSERYMGEGGGGVSVTTNVYLNGDGTATTETSGGSDETARELGNVVSAKVREELIQQQRPGGLLWRMQYG